MALDHHDMTKELDTFLRSANYVSKKAVECEQRIFFSYLTFALFFSRPLIYSCFLKHLYQLTLIVTTLVRFNQAKLSDFITCDHIEKWI